jgi:hypothetical protein
MCQNQGKQPKKVRELYCGTNKFKLTAIPNDKPDIIIRDNEKKNMYVNRCCNLRWQKCD